MRNHLALGLIVLSAASQTAHAEWTICNKTPEPLTVAIAYASNRGGHIVTEGWWKIRSCGGCATVLRADETADTSTTYLHAKTDRGGVYVGGDENFCTSRSKFKYKSTPGCAEKSSFQQTKVNLNRQWRTNITGKSSNGGRCVGD